MVKIVLTHPDLVAEHQDTILASVDDQDISIRMRALDLVTALVSHFRFISLPAFPHTIQVTRHNLQSIVQQLLSHLVQQDGPSLPSAVRSLSQHVVPTIPSKASSAPSQSPAYRLVLSQSIISMCSSSTYDNVLDFEWYLSVLVDLAYISNVDIGGQIRDQLVDVVGRVRAARAYAVKLMVKVLSDETFLLNAGEPGSCSEVLWAAAWICGEFCEYVSYSVVCVGFGLYDDFTANYWRRRNFCLISYIQTSHCWTPILLPCIFKLHTKYLGTGLLKQPSNGQTICWKRSRVRWRR